MKAGESYNSCRIAVPAAFEPVFTHFYFAENKSGEAVRKTFLPSYQTILVFNFGTHAVLHSRHKNQLEIDQCMVVGPIRQAFDYTLSIGAEILVANFKDDAFYRFFGENTLAEHVPINPDDLLDENCFTALWKELKNIGDVAERISHILAFCAPYLRQQTTIAGQLTRSREQALNPIKAIAAEHKQTARNIQLNHKKQLGYSAKEINRYQRFLKAIDLLQHLVVKEQKIDWFELIEACGYYDQSQLIHDFRHYLNLSPTRYLKFQQDICSARS